MLDIIHFLLQLVRLVITLTLAMADNQPPASSPLANDAELRASSSHEKQTPAKEGGPRSRAERVHEFHGSEGYIIDIGSEDGLATAGIKLAEDGRTVLIPQPSDDGNDPLNWTWSKKHLILFVVSFASFLPDYGSATGAVTLIPQAA